MLENNPSEDAPTWKDFAHLYFKDHHILREFWWNLSEVSPGLWRANQPGPRQIQRYKWIGIKSIVSLRNEGEQGPTRIVKRACARLGLDFISARRVRARKLVEAQEMLRVVEKIDAAPKPTLIHCKSGADRTGLAVALYLILKQDVLVETAAKQLSLRFIHNKKSDAGVLSHLFRYYLRNVAPDGTAFRDWLLSDYDPETVTQDFEDWRHGTGAWR